jgi:transcriptional regulator with XRE-family HTH domain
LLRAAITEVTIIPGQPGPLVRRRQLGAALRRLRNDAGLSLREVADSLLSSPSKISRIESAQRNISARDVRDLMDLYRVTSPGIRDELMRLVEESRQSAWWAEFNLDPGYERLIGLEGAAAVIFDYQLGAIPGLLQTSAYATAMTRAWTDDVQFINNAVGVRMARQRILDQAVKLEFVFDESVLRRSVGGREIMHDQIRKLIDLATGSEIQIQTIPLSAGAHQGLAGGFIIVQFPRSDLTDPASNMSDIVYREGVVGPGAYLEQPDEVQDYLTAFRGLQAVALSRQATIAFMEDILRSS